MNEIEMLQQALLSRTAIAFRSILQVVHRNEAGAMVKLANIESICNQTIRELDGLQETIRKHFGKEDELEDIKF